jgi:hypothetical protein
MSVVSNQLDYQKYQYSYPSYKLSKLLPLSGSTSQTITASGGQEVLFELPAKIMNLSRGYLSFDFDPSEGGNGKFNYIPCDTISPIRQIQLYTRGGLYLCDLNEVANYIKVVLKPETKIEDYLKFDRCTAAAASASGHFQGLTPCNAVAAIPPTTILRSNNTAIDVSFLEPRYQLVGADNSGPNVNFRIPLYILKNTIFAIDKDLLFDEVLVMRIVFQANNKIHWFASAANDPAGGATAPTGNTLLNNIQLMIPIETNNDIIQGIREKKNSSEGLSILLPYVYTSRFVSSASTSQNVSLRYNRGHGLRLLKIYHSVFNGTETINNIYDHTNVAAAKVSSFYTMLDNNRMQEFNISPSLNEDYLLLNDKLRGSVVMSSSMYNYNWFWLDDFTGTISPLEEPKQPEDESNFIQGLDLNTERKWDIVMTTANSGFNHYTFSITQKLLTISNNGIQVM